MRRTLPASKASLHLSPHLGPQLIVRRKLSSRSGARPKRAICNMFLRPTGRARSLRFNKSTRSSWRVSEVSPRLSPSLRLLLIARQRLSSKRGSKAKKVRCSMFLRPSGRTHSAPFIRSTRRTWLEFALPRKRPTRLLPTTTRPPTQAPTPVAMMAPHRVATATNQHRRRHPRSYRRFLRLTVPAAMAAAVPPRWQKARRQHPLMAFAQAAPTTTLTPPRHRWPRMVQQQAALLPPPMKLRPPPRLP
mmetsp:Transcript_106178/g.265943  ORF Transcript_106178/g.265943 Transcript_106178/m.265943 type:complete len:247 (-) Transcript_106178:238-978(-)